MGQKDHQKDWTHLSRRHVIDANYETFHLSIYGGKLTDCVNIGEEICQLVEEMGFSLLNRDKQWFGEPNENLHKSFLDEASKLDLTIPFCSKSCTNLASV